MRGDALLYDEVHKWTYDAQRPGDIPGAIWQEVLRQYRMELRSARRFAIGDEIIALAVEMSGRVDRLPLWTSLARIPFEKVWIEWDGKAKGRALAASERTPEEDPDLSEVSDRHGVLLTLDGNHPTRWAGTEFNALPEGGVIPLSFRYVFDPEGTEADPARGATGLKPIHEAFPGIAPGAAHALMGFANPDGERNPRSVAVYPWFEHKSSATAERGYHALFTQRQIRCKRADPSGRMGEDDRNRMARNLEMGILEWRGSTRILVTLLALLNEVPMSYADVPARAGKMAGLAGNAPYLSHQTVTIALPGKRRLAAASRILTKAFQRRRAHEVRGHWRRVSRDSLSQAIVYGSDGIPRVWIQSHVRGDASIGWVQKLYRVEGDAVSERDVETT